MIVKEKDAKKSEFYGVSIDILAIGKKSMIARMNYKNGDKVPLHNHPNEQNGYIVTGKIRMKFSEYDEILVPGDSYSIPKGTKHSVEVLEDSTVLDFFSPPRQDYL
jgi:quercetin dioxygenase-like cupin family protein